MLKLFSKWSRKITEQAKYKWLVERNSCSEKKWERRNREEKTWKKKQDKEIGDKRNNREVTGNKKQREKQTGKKRDAGNQTIRERNRGKMIDQFFRYKNYRSFFFGLKIVLRVFYM